MATTTASLTLTSTDLLTNELSLFTSSTLTTSTSATAGLTKTTGLGRTNFVSTDPASRSKIIYRAEDATTNLANKVYLKNLSSIAAEYFHILIDQEEVGRLFAGDWAFFPWSATKGTLETFVVTSAGTVAAGDSWNFDGITTTSADANSTNFAIAVDAQHYPNWTTSIATAAVTFTARQAGVNGVVTAGTTNAIDGDTITDLASSDLTMAITAAAVGTRSEADIVVESSVVTTMDLEHILINE